MMREARNYGVGFLFADQVPQREHTTVRSNLGTKLLFRLEDPAALESFKAGMGLNQQQQNLILNLPDRHLVMRRPDTPFPFQVKVQRLF
jgi:DNA helicase HerA-like ATPase